MTHAKTRRTPIRSTRTAFSASFAASRAKWLLPIVFASAAPLAAAHGNDHGLDAHNFDTAAGACRDFFQYANGGWLKANPIPAAYSRWSLDDEINERNEALLKQVLESAATKPGSHGSTTQKVGDFFAAAMDEEAIENAGLSALKGDLDAIAALHTPADLTALISAWQRRGDAVLFEIQAQPDLKNSDIDIAYAGQGGIGLPD